MKGSSAPGIDGFTVNWLRKFWDSLKLVTFNAINECYRDGTLTPLKTGIIRLLRKGQKDPTLTGNYRPISLLSIHYIINILNLMKYTNRKKIESLILLIDFRKAFDSLSHKYIDECLKMFNFGPSIRKWVSLFFSNRKACILLRRELTKKILLE